jgi:putative endonuclease
MHYVYILYSKTLSQTYVGETTNLEKRIKQHKTDNTRTTNGSDDYSLVWHAVFSNELKAKAFERYLKTHSGRVFMRKRLLGDLMESI